MVERSVLDSPYSWLRLGVTVLCAIISSIGIWSIVPTLPLAQVDFGVGRGEASIAYVATMLGFAAGNLLIGRFVDRFGASTALMGAAVALGAGYALAARAPDIWTFSLAQGALIGVGAATGFGPLIADISHWFMKRRGIAVAIAACGNYLAGVLWPLGLQSMFDVGDWRGAYDIIALSAILLLPPLALALRRRPPEAARAAAATRAATAARDIGLSPRALQWLLSLAGVGCCVAMAMPQVHIVALCVDYGFGVAAGAQMLALMLAGGVASRLVAGMLADRIGGLRTLLLSATLQCIGLMLFIPFDGLNSLYVVSLVFGLSQGGIVPSYAIIVREYMSPREAGRRVGFVIMATVLGMALGGWMSGAIFDLTGGYRWAFLNGIGWNLMNIGVIAFIMLRIGRAQSGRGGDPALA